MNSFYSYTFAAADYTQLIEIAKATGYVTQSANLFSNTTTGSSYLFINDNNNGIDNWDMIIEVTGYTGTFTTANFVTSDINVH